MHREIIIITQSVASGFIFYSNNWLVKQKLLSPTNQNYCVTQITSKNMRFVIKSAFNGNAQFHKKKGIGEDKDNRQRVFYSWRALSFHVIAMYS